MDPNATLELWRDGDDQAKQDLAGWIRQGGFAPKWTAKEKAEIYRLLGRGPNKPRKRAKKNPRAHYPKTQRGRPAHERSFQLELYGANGDLLRTRKFKATREKATEKARAAVGSKVGRKEVHRVVLED